MEIIEKLFELKDEKYGDFQSRLTPGIARESFIGVRVPAARKLVKELIKEESYGESYNEFLNNLPHKYYDENIVHALLISEIKDYDECIGELGKFLPFVDNWAVCDIISPKVFKKNHDRLISDIEKWIGDKETYTIRFGIGMLMQHFLDEDFKAEYLEMPAAVHSEEYYINMMIAWYFATALAKQWDDAIEYIKENRLDKWTHNKTIQKSCESYRISDEKKKLLREMKR